MKSLQYGDAVRACRDPVIAKLHSELINLEVVSFGSGYASHMQGFRIQEGLQPSWFTAMRKEAEKPEEFTQLVSAGELLASHMPESLKQSARDFGLGKCYVEVTFQLIASDDDGLLDHAHVVIAADDVKSTLEEK